MVRGSAAYAAIKDNVASALNIHLRGGPCRAYSEGLKIVTPAPSHYPGVVVTCKSVQPSDDRIGEPVVLVEILSRTTADRDRGAKWVGGQEIASLQHYMLIAQDHRRADLLSRADDRWEIRVVRPPAARVALPPLGVELSLDEIYEDSGA
jgi:Uma2 family endonuclease